MDWLNIEDESILDAIKTASGKNPVVIFKHSTRCSISASALGRLERAWNKEEMKDTPFYFLDLLAHRDISQKISEEFDIEHQSPQILIVSNGECVYTTSHLNISYPDIKNQISKNKVRS